MTRERLYLYDTTLRDGQQTQGVQFSTEEKRAIATALDTLGVDYIEGGWPGANPTDSAFFETAPVTRATMTAFGMTKRTGMSAQNDDVLAAVLNAGTSAVCLVGKTHDFHVKAALGVSLAENTENISKSIAHLVAQGREALFDAEHFFDGYRANPDYALEAVRAACDAGARWVVLCDTNGGTLPEEVGRITAQVIAAGIPGDRLGIHTHNATENAVACTLAAVDAGARQIQGTLNGLGERCGNANMTSIIPTLLLKSEFANSFETGITPERLRTLTHASRVLDEVLNRAPDRHAPYVGESAFATKAGIHASAILKEPETYEHVRPEAVGNERRLLVSKQAGRSNVIAALERMGLVSDRDDERISGLLEEVKAREAAGYSYEAAEASFEMLARRTLANVPQYFTVDSFRVMVERRHNALGKLVTVSEAIVKVFINGDTDPLWSVGEGNGPVNALDQALRKDLGRYQKYIEGIELVDYKVRILTGGTEAVTRVLVETLDTLTGERWITVGVSPNIIDASFEALLDSINYKLFRDGAEAA